jgi:hypothetical protein
MRWDKKARSPTRSREVSQDSRFKQARALVSEILSDYTEKSVPSLSNMGYTQ